MGKQKRRQFSEQFKFKVALEAAKGQRTINEIASAYEVASESGEQLEKATARRGGQCLQSETRP